MSQCNKQICIKVTTDSQFDSIRPIFKRFVENKISFDIFIPLREENSLNVNTMFNKTYEIVKKEGFGNYVVRKVSPDKKYHLALITPNYEQGITAKYYVKYSYGPSHTVKPIFTHKAHRLNHYHGYLLHSKRDVEIFSVLSKTYLLPDLKYIGYRKAISSEAKKQTILFLPSWEGQNSLDWIVSTTRKLKQDYRIIVKLHPYGDFGAEVPKSVDNVKSEIKKVADEFYEGEASLKELLAHSDLVVSDISGAVFDALYVGVPVTIFSKDIHKFDLPGIKSGCAKYVEEGYISLSNTPDTLAHEVPNALSNRYLKKQQVLSNKVFKQDFTSKALDSWMKIINLYLNDEVNQEYIAMHNLMSEEFWQYKSEADRLNTEVQTCNDKISKISIELNAFTGIRRSATLLVGNIKRKAKKTLK